MVILFLRQGENGKQVLLTFPVTTPTEIADVAATLETLKSMSKTVTIQGAASEVMNLGLYLSSVDLVAEGEVERIDQLAKRLEHEEPSAEKTSTDASTNPTLANENTSFTPSRPAQLPSEYLLNSTIRLFHQMGQIFRDNAAPPSNPMGIRVDSKRRKKLMQKRLAMGHKQDDHEQNYGQTLQ